MISVSDAQPVGLDDAGAVHSLEEFRWDCEKGAAKIMKLSISARLFVCLAAAYGILNALFVFFPTVSALPIPTQSLPAPKIVVALISAATAVMVYGGLGYLGLVLSRKIGFADVWDENVTNKERFFVPAIVGLLLGIVFVIVDVLAGSQTSFGRLPHPGFPASLFVPVAAAIGEESIFRLFFISFGVWLVSCIILKGKVMNIVFWVVSIASAFVFAAGHIPSVLILKGLTSPSQIPPLTLVEMFFLNSIVSLPAAYLFRKNGILAAMGVHFWTDTVWHVIYGLA